jgi:hypothetical protein
VLQFYRRLSQKEDMPETTNILMCPFCWNRYVIAKQGKVHCPMCDSEFEVNDRLECIFVDPDKLKISAEGTVCSLCGLIQDDDVEKCLYCGVRINSNLQ